MTNVATTETQTPAQALAAAKLTQANARLAHDESLAAFQKLIESRGEGMTLDEQLAVSTNVGKTEQAVKFADASVENHERAVKVSAIEAPTKTIRDAIKAALDKVDLAKLMDESEMGASIVFTATFAHDAEDKTKRLPWAISQRIVGAGAAPKATAAATSTGTAAGSNGFEYEGKTYSSKELLEAFAQQKIDDGSLKWTGNFLDSVGLSHRADTLATKLGATKVKVS